MVSLGASSSSTPNGAHAMGRIGYALVLVGLFAFVPQVQSEETIRTSSSLEFVPADAAFYRACLRNREQFDAVIQSNAVQQLLQRPRMAKWVDSLKARWDDPDRGPVGRWLARPENRELTDFAVDAVSHEIFWYGEASVAELMDLTAYLNEAAASAQLEALRNGRSLADSERAAAYAALRIVAQDPQELRVPTVVIGFRVTDRERAQRQIARLDELLKSLLDEPAQARREQIGEEEFLTWRLSGGMLPWDLVPKSEMEKVDPELRRRVRAVLDSKNATLTVGVRGDYLLISLGENNGHLAKLGQGPLLADRPELAPLMNFADRPLNSIAYVSQAYRERAVAAQRHQFTGSFLLEEFITHPDGLAAETPAVDEQTRGELVADLKLLTAQVSDAARARGATLRFSLLTPHGYEGYYYDWSQYDRLDGDAPLTVLNHLGGEPLGFFALRRNFTVEDYDQWVKWLKRGAYYFDKIGLNEMTPENRALFLELRRQLEPQLERLDLATRELLIPAIADGQKAIVLDASPRSETVYVGEVETEASAQSPADDLPRLELACVLGVSDSEKFKEACREYLAVAGEIWNGVRGFIEETRSEADQLSEAPRLIPGELPKARDLRPRVESTSESEVYFYELPARWKASDRIAPNMGLSENFAVMSWLPAYTQRLLEQQPLQIDGSLSDADQPLAAASYLNIAGVLDAVEPWLQRLIERRQERLAARADPRSRETAAPRAQAPSSRGPQSSPTPRAAQTPPASSRAAAPPAASPRALLPQPPAASPRAPNASQRAASVRVPQPPPSVRIPSPPPAAAQEPASRAAVTPAEPEAPRVSLEEAKERLHFTLDLLRCFRSFSSATHHDGKAWITHYQIRIEDFDSPHDSAE
jgi:hypothetical protein